MANEISPQSAALLASLTPGKASAKYDWLTTYSNAMSGDTYGDANDPLSVKNRIIKDAGSDFADAQKAGIIREDGSVDWSKAPAFSLPNAPKNAQWNPTGGRGGMVDPWSNKAVTSGVGGTGVYHDDNYGDMYLQEQRAPDDLGMKLGKMAAMGMFMGPMASTFAPMITSGLGLSGGFANSSIASLLKAVPGLIQSGGNSIMSLLGGIAGGATGIPGAGTVGGLTGTYAAMTPAQREALRQQLSGN